MPGKASKGSWKNWEHFKVQKQKVGGNWLEEKLAGLAYLGSGWKRAEDLQEKFGPKIGEFGETKLDSQKVLKAKRVGIRAIGVTQYSKEWTFVTSNSNWKGTDHSGQGQKNEEASWEDHSSWWNSYQIFHGERNEYKNEFCIKRRKKK